jgi:ComF family protein
MNIKEFILFCFMNTLCCSCQQEWHFFCLQCSQKIEKYKPYCYVCKKYSENFMIHTSCMKIFPNISQIIVLTRYKVPIMKKILRLGKYHNKFVVYNTIIRWNIEFFKEYISKEDSIIIPIPMHFFRKWKRWYNQAEIIAHNLSKHLNIPIRKNFLIKKTYTKQQSRLSYKERYNNLSGSFILKKITSIPKNTHIYLVDDIVSTGSTLLEVSEVLSKNGFKKISAVCLASD